MPQVRKFDLIRWVLGVQVSGQAKAVLHALVWHHNMDTGQCNPNQRLLAQEAGCSVTTLKRILTGELQSWVLRHKTQTTTQYTLLCPLLGHSAAQALEQEPEPRKTSIEDMAERDVAVAAQAERLAPLRAALGTTKQGQELMRFSQLGIPHGYVDD